MMEVLCPHCNRQLKVPPQFAGKVIPCPACKQKLMMPHDDPGYEVVPLHRLHPLHRLRLRLRLGSSSLAR